MAGRGIELPLPSPGALAVSKKKKEKPEFTPEQRAAIISIVKERVARERKASQLRFDEQLAEVIATYEKRIAAIEGKQQQSSKPTVSKSGDFEAGYRDWSRECFEGVGRG